MSTSALTSSFDRYGRFLKPVAWLGSLALAVSGIQLIQQSFNSQPAAAVPSHVGTWASSQWVSTANSGQADGGWIPATLWLNTDAADTSARTNIVLDDETLYYTSGRSNMHNYQTEQRAQTKHIGTFNVDDGSGAVAGTGRALAWWGYNSVDAGTAPYFTTKGVDVAVNNNLASNRGEAAGTLAVDAGGQQVAGGATERTPTLYTWSMAGDYWTGLSETLVLYRLTNANGTQDFDGDSVLDMTKAQAIPIPLPRNAIFGTDIPNDESSQRSIDFWSGGEVLQRTGELYLSNGENCTLFNTCRWMILDPTTFEYNYSGKLAPATPQDAIFTGNLIVNGNDNTNYSYTISDMAMDADGNIYVIAQGNEAYPGYPDRANRVWLIRIVPSTDGSAWTYNVVTKLNAAPNEPTSQVASVHGWTNGGNGFNDSFGAGYYNGQMYVWEETLQMLLRVDMTTGFVHSIPDDSRTRWMQNDRPGFEQRTSNTSADGIWGVVTDLAAGQAAMVIAGNVYNDANADGQITAADYQTDVNGDGTVDIGDAGLADQVVALYQRDDAGQYTYLAQRATDASGNYSFMVPSDGEFIVGLVQPQITVGTQKINAAQTFASGSGVNQGPEDNVTTARCVNVAGGLTTESGGACAGAKQAPFIDPPVPQIWSEIVNGQEVVHDDSAWIGTAMDPADMAIYSNVSVATSTELAIANFGVTAAGSTGDAPVASLLAVGGPLIVHGAAATAPLYLGATAGVYADGATDNSHSSDDGITLNRSAAGAVDLDGQLLTAGKDYTLEFSVNGANAAADATTRLWYTAAGGTWPNTPLDSATPGLLTRTGTLSFEAPTATGDGYFRAIVGGYLTSGTGPDSPVGLLQGTGGSTTTAPTQFWTSIGEIEDYAAQIVDAQVRIGVSATGLDATDSFSFNFGNTQDLGSGTAETLNWAANATTVYSNTSHAVDNVGDDVTITQTSAPADYEIVDVTCTDTVTGAAAYSGASVSGTTVTIPDVADGADITCVLAYDVPIPVPSATKTQVSVTQSQTVGTDATITVTVLEDDDTPMTQLASGDFVFSVPSVTGNGRTALTVSPTSYIPGTNPGEYQFKVSSNIVGEWRIETTVAGVAIDAKPTTTFTVGAVCHQGCTPETAVIDGDQYSDNYTLVKMEANGVLAGGNLVSGPMNTASAYAYDKFGNPVSGAPVIATADAASAALNPQVTSPAVTTDTTGKATLAWVSDTPGIYSATVTVAGTQPTYGDYHGVLSNITFSSTAASLTNSSVEISPQTAQPAGSSFTITVTVRDASPVPTTLGNQTVSFTADPGATLSAPSCTTQATGAGLGTCTVTVTATRANTYQVHASIGGQEITGTPGVYGGSPVSATFHGLDDVCNPRSGDTCDPDLFTHARVELNNQPIITGLDLVRVYVYDRYGNPILMGRNVVQASSTAVIVSGDGAMGADGQKLFEFSSPTAGDHNAMFAVNGEPIYVVQNPATPTVTSNSAILNFQTTGASAANSTLTVVGQNPANPLINKAGESFSATVVVRDAGGSLLAAGQTVNFSVDAPATFSGGGQTATCTTDATSSCHVEFSSQAKGPYVIHAMLGSVDVSNSPQTVTVTAADPCLTAVCDSKVTLIRDGASIDAVGGANANQIRAEVFDGFGNGVPGVQLSSAQIGGNQLTVSAIQPTDNNGITIIEYTSAAQGSFQVGVDLAGTALVGSPVSMSFSGEQGDLLQSWFTINQPGPLTVGTGADNTYRLTAQVRNTLNQPVANNTVRFSFATNAMSADQIDGITWTTAAGPVTGSQASCVTDAQGTCFVDVYSTYAGMYTFQGELGTQGVLSYDVAGAAVVSADRAWIADDPCTQADGCTPVDPDPGKTSRVEPVVDGSVADGATVNIARVYLFDRYNNPVPGAAVATNTSETAAGTQVPVNTQVQGPVTIPATNASGFTDIAYKSTVAATHQVGIQVIGWAGKQATDANLTPNNAAPYDTTFVPGPACVGAGCQSYVTVDATGQTVGVQGSAIPNTVTVHLKDVNGNAVPGVAVSSVAANPTVIVVPRGTPDSNGDFLTGSTGEFSFDYYSTLAVQTRVQLFATLNGAETEVVYTGNPVIPGVTDAAHPALSSPVTLNWQADQPCLSAVCDSKVTLIRDGASIDAAGGANANQIRAEVYDGFGNGVSGVQLSSAQIGGTQITVSAIAPTDSSGITVIEYTSTAQGRFQVGVDLAGTALVGSPVSMSFSGEQGDLLQSWFTIDKPGPLTVGTGVDNTYRLTAQVRNTLNQPVANNTVMFSFAQVGADQLAGITWVTDSGPVTGSQASCVTDAQGTCFVDVYSTYAGTYTFQGELGTQGVLGYETAGAAVVSADRSWVADDPCTQADGCTPVDPDPGKTSRVEPVVDGSVADGSTANIARVYLFDRFNNPVSGATVATNTPETATGTSVPVNTQVLASETIPVTNASGFTEIQYTSTVATAHQVGIQVVGWADKQPTDANLTPNNAAPYITSFVPGAVCMGDGCQSYVTVDVTGQTVGVQGSATPNTVTVHLKDVNGNPVPGVAVSSSADNPVVAVVPRGTPDSNGNFVTDANGEFSFDYYSTQASQTQVQLFATPGGAASQISYTGDPVIPGLTDAAHPALSSPVSLSWQAAEPCVNPDEQGCVIDPSVPYERRSHILVDPDGKHISGGTLYTADADLRNIANVYLYDQFGNPFAGATITSAANPGHSITRQADIAVTDTTGKTTVWHTSTVPSIELPEGSHQAQVFASWTAADGSVVGPYQVNFVSNPAYVDASGQPVSPPMGFQSSPFTMTFVDTEKPLAPVITGPSTGDLVDTGTPTVTGTGEPGAVVDVDANDKPVCQTTVGADGTWSCTVSKLPDGDVELVATQTDPSLNTSDPSDSVQIGVDTVPPDSPSVTEPSHGADTNDTTPSIKGEDSEPGNQIVVTDDPNNTPDDPTDDIELCKAVVQADGTWSCDPVGELGEGNHNLITTETDPTGNQSDPDCRPINVDITPPGDPTVDPSNGTEFTGTGDSDAAINIVDQDGNPVPGCTGLAVDDTGHWSCTPETPIKDGQTAEAQATDPAGNTSQPVKVTVAGIGIVLGAASLYPTEEQTVTGVHFHVGEQVTGVVNSDEPIDLGTVVADAEGNAVFKAFNIPVDLSFGEHTVTLIGSESGSVSKTFQVLAPKAIETGLPTLAGGHTTTLGVGMLSGSVLLAIFLILLAGRRRPQEDPYLSVR